MNPVLRSGPILVLAALSLTALTPFAIHKSVSRFVDQSRTATWDSTVATLVIPIPGHPRKIAPPTPPALPPPGSRLKQTPPVIRSAQNEPTTPYYTFTVGDQIYVSQRFDSHFGNIADPSLKFMAGKSSETPITIYYNHQDPNQAVVRPGVRFSDLSPALLACTLLPAFTLLAWHQIWILRRNETGPMAGLPRFRLRNSSLDAKPLRIAA